MSIQHRLTKKQDKTEAGRLRRIFITNLPIARSRVEVGDFIRQQGFDGNIICYWEWLEKDGPHKGRCWVSFADEATAQRASAALNGLVFGGRSMRVVRDGETKAGMAANQPSDTPSAPQQHPAPQAGPSQPVKGTRDLTLAERSASMGKYLKGVQDLDEKLEKEMRAAPQTTHQPEIVDSSKHTTSVGGMATHTTAVFEQARPIVRLPVVPAAPCTVDESKALQCVPHAAEVNTPPSPVEPQPTIEKYTFFLTPYTLVNLAQANQILESIRLQFYPTSFSVIGENTLDDALTAFIERCKRIDSAYMRAGVQGGAPVLQANEHKGGANPEPVVMNALIARHYPAPSSDNDSFAQSLPVYVYKDMEKVSDFWEGHVDKTAVPGSSQAIKQDNFPDVKRIVDVKTVLLRDVASYVSDGWDVWYQVITPHNMDTRTIPRILDVLSMNEPWKDTMSMFSVGIRLSGIEWSPGMTLPLGPQGSYVPDPFKGTTFSPPSETGNIMQTATSACHALMDRRPTHISAGWGDHDLFRDWQAHGRQVKLEMIDKDREWLKSSAGPLIFEEDGNPSKQYKVTVMPKGILEQLDMDGQAMDNKLETLYERKAPKNKKGAGKATYRRTPNPGAW